MFNSYASWASICSLSLWMAMCRSFVQDNEVSGLEHAYVDTDKWGAQNIEASLLLIWRSSRFYLKLCPGFCIMSGAFTEGDRSLLSKALYQKALTCESDGRPSSVQCTVMSDVEKDSCVRCLLKRMTPRSPPARIVAHICKRYHVI